MVYKSVYTIIYQAYAKDTQVYQSVPNIKHKDNSSQNNIISRESIKDKEGREGKKGKD